MVSLSLSAGLQSHLLFNVHTLRSKEHLRNLIFKTEVNKEKRRSKQAYYLESFVHKGAQKGHCQSLNSGAWRNQRLPPRTTVGFTAAV